MLLLACLAGTVANAQLLDSTWAVNGYTQDPNFRDESVALAIQSDGKVLAGLNRGQTQNGMDDLYLCRFKTDGTLDSSFGTNGIGAVWIGEKAMTRGLAIQPDGKIVAIGHATYCVAIICGLDNLVLARFNTNGTPDTSFGVNGKVLSEYVFGNTVMSGLGMRVKVLPTGKILTSGVYIFQSTLWGTERHAFVAQFNSDGTLDTSFGTGGKTVLGKYDVIYPYYDDLQDMAVDNAGNIFCTGTAYYPGTGLANPSDAYVTKLKPNGDLDTSFGNAGELLLDQAPLDQPFALALRPDGKLFVAGNCGEASVDSPRSGIIYVVNSSDGSYSNDIPGGFRKISGVAGYPTEIYSMILQPDNKIVVCGISDSTNLRGGLIARFNPDGSDDQSFTGSSNRTFYRLTSNPQWTTPLYYIKQQQDGKLIAAGYRAVQGAGRTVLVMRIKPKGGIGPSGIAGGATSAMEARVFPNPLTAQSTLRFRLDRSDQVTVYLTDLSGRLVRTIINGVRMNAGIQSVSLEGLGDLPRGVYNISMRSSSGAVVHQKVEL